MRPDTASASDLYLFDIDGTLVSMGGAGRRAFERACHEVLDIPSALHGFALDGMTDPLILHHVYQTHKSRLPSDDESAQLFARYLQLLEATVADTPLTVHESVPEILAHLQSIHATVGLATGNLAEGARIKLERPKLWHHFGFGGFGSDAVLRADLVRIGIARGHRAAATPPDRVFVIGDTPRDIEAAHDAGAIAIGVATGSYTVAQLEAAGADQAYPTLTTWLQLLM